MWKWVPPISWYFCKVGMNKENSDLTEMFAAMPFHPLSLNCAIHYWNIIRSKPPLAHDDSSGLGRSRMIFYHLNSVGTFWAKHQNSPYKEREHQNSSQRLEYKMKNVNHSPATFRTVNDESMDLLLGHFDHLLHTPSHPAQGWMPPARSRGP